MEKPSPKPFTNFTRLTRTALFIVIFLVLGSFTGYLLSSFLFSSSTLSLPFSSEEKDNLTQSQYPLPNWNLTDPRKIIAISHPLDIEKKRTELIQFIWKSPQLPTALPDQIEKDYKDKRYAKIKNLKSIDKITTPMEFGLKSVAYHFKSSKKSKDKLIIYVQGHEGDFIYGYHTISFFLSEGYDVLAFSMPLYGLNSELNSDTGRFAQFVEIERQGTINLIDHNAFFFIDNRTFTSIKFFVHPLALALNLMEQEYTYETFIMLGSSGGGWTTTLYTALDPRISKSYPVASPQPFYLLSNDYDYYMGADYETINPELYRIADFLDLYIMGASGEGRSQIQILNKYDPCCFAGVGYKTYEHVVSERVKSLGPGSFSVFSDDSHKEHKISDVALKVILKDIEHN